MCGIVFTTFKKIENMEIEKFEIPKGLENILLKYETALGKKKEFELGFNVFSLVSDTYYKENFHSEIIHSFLNPEGTHGEGRIFLDEFICLFSKTNKVRISNSDYLEKVEAHNEFGILGKRRIDLLITSSTNAIIIENKMNNAVDMVNQLVDYYKYCKGEKPDGLKRKVDAIFYLSLDGKKPDKNSWSINDKELFEEIDNKLVEIVAFDNKEETNTIYNWLEKCKKVSKSEDTKFIIKQYQQLLKHLRKFMMETKALEEYFEFISKPENEQISKDIKMWMSMHSDLSMYYPQRLLKKIEANSSLKYLYGECKYHPEVFAIFDRIGGSNYYLMVGFESDGYNIVVKNNDKNDWKNDSKFNTKFEPNGNWILETKKFNLITEFEEIIVEVEDSLKMVSDIIKS
jgi:hypothetical protein